MVPRLSINHLEPGTNKRNGLITNTFKVGGSFDWEIPVVEETQERVDRSVPSVMVQMTVLLSKVEIFRLYLVLNHL